MAVFNELVSKGVYKVPEWAVGYLANGDPSGLSDEEIAAVDNWCALFSSEGPVTFDWIGESHDSAVQAFAAGGEKLDFGNEAFGPKVVDCEVFVNI